MSGEMDLGLLLVGLEPVLREGGYVFCTSEEPPFEYLRALEVEALATFREEEGVTLVVRQEEAERVGLAQGEGEGVWRCITLQIHSSLEAVGLTAVVASALAEVGISANVIAAYYHDHVFVPALRADEAVEVLRGLSSTES